MYPIVLSFDVGVINLSYCLLTKKDFNNKLDWEILDWGIINLTDRDNIKCHCGLPAKMSNITDNINYYCMKHSKNININVEPFETYYISNNTTNKCCYNNKNLCNKKAPLLKNDNDNNTYCNTHAKQLYKTYINNNKMKPFKFKSSKLLNFDDVKYNLIMELEKRTNLLKSDYVVIENQPSFKNPRMKSIASTIYDYYLIRGVIDKNITKSTIKSVKFMSPSNKLKLATEGDSKLLVKAKKTDDTKAYKLTKSLGIKYCSEMIQHLPKMLELFNSMKKKDDMADSFLQGAYFYNNN
jgi:hypothetical protein